MTHTIKDVCERYRVSETTVLIWIQRGDLKAVNVAPVHGAKPQWRISARALEDFERSRTTYPKPKRQAPRRKRQLAGAADRY